MLSCFRAQTISPRVLLRLHVKAQPQLPLKCTTAEPQSAGSQCPLCPRPLQPVLRRALLTGPALTLLCAHACVLHAPLRRGQQSHSHPTGTNMQLVRESAPSGEPLPKKSQGDTTSSAGLRSAITWQCCWRCCSPWLAPRVCSQPQNTLGVRLNEEFPVETVLPAISDPIILPAAQLCLSPFFYPSLTHPPHQASIPHPSQPAPLPAFIHPSMSLVIPLGPLPSLNPSSQAPSTLPDPNPTHCPPQNQPNHDVALLDHFSSGGETC